MDVKKIKKEFPIGTKIKCIHMVKDPRPIPDGATGIVQFIDDIGTIHIRWENGRLFGIVPGVDKFSKVVSDETN